MDYFTTMLNKKASDLREKEKLLIENTLYEYFDDPSKVETGRVKIVYNPNSTNLVIDGLKVLKIYKPEVAEDTQSGTDTTIHLTIPYEKDLENGVDP